MGSASVKKLKTALNAKLIKLEGSRFRHNGTDTIINWGNSRRSEVLPAMSTHHVLNNPENVALAANKLTTLQQLAGEVPTVPFTTSQEIARQWSNEGFKIFSRHSLTGHSGEGIEVITPIQETAPTDFIEEAVQDVLSELIQEAETDSQRVYLSNLLQAALATGTPRSVENVATLPSAPLYTKGIINTGEYRVHVAGGEVILYQKKSRRVNEDGEVVTADGAEADVRNLASNWVYRTGNLERLERIEQLAVQAIDALGLDFGAVDIIKDEEGRVYVLEVNTAPGLGNADSLEAYVEAFSHYDKDTIFRS